MGIDSNSKTRHDLDWVEEIELGLHCACGYLWRPIVADMYDKSEEKTAALGSLILIVKLTMSHLSNA